MKRSMMMACSVVLLAGCNSVLGNDDRLLDDTFETLPERKPDRPDHDSSPEVPAADEADGGVADAAPDGDADAADGDAHDGDACSFVCDAACVDLATDELNCGSCGSACPAAKSCKAGVCS
jgi:hypothetical protein